MNGTQAPAATDQDIKSKVRILVAQAHPRSAVEESILREFAGVPVTQIKEAIQAVYDEVAQAEADAEENTRPAREKADREERAAEEAERILMTGKPFDFIIKTFKQDHEGDLTVAHVVALTFAASAVANGDGLHTYVSGASGRGKTHAAETMFQQLPDSYRYDRAFSDKYLYYAGTDKGSGLVSGAVILIDDQTMSDAIQELFKVSSSKYREDVQYGTVQAQKAITLKMPSRISWVLLKVDDPGDDQTMNRLVQARIDEKESKVKESADRIQLKYKDLAKRTVKEIRWDLLVARAIWKQIKGLMVAVEVPCAGHVVFGSYHNLRSHELFFNMVMSLAIIHRWQRKEIGKTEDGIPIIEASYSDFKEAKLIFEALYEFGGQAYNTLKAEDEVIDALVSMDPAEGYFTIRDVAQVTGKSTNTIYRAIKGKRAQNGEVLGGLLSKCPCIQGAGKRGKHEVESEIENRKYAEIVRKTSFNEEIYFVDVGALKIWKEHGDVVSLTGFKWEGQ